MRHNRYSAYGERKPNVRVGRNNHGPAPPAQGRLTGYVLAPMTRHGAAMLDRMVNHQARIIAYDNDYRMMTFVVIPGLLLLLLLMRRHEPRPAPVPAAGD
jgi:hypothetical protein